MRKPEFSGRAVVVGGSLSGLAAAQVLTEHFAEVVLIERDDFSRAREHRSGVPQAHHTHVLLKLGEQILDRLVPGTVQALHDAGAPIVRWGPELRWYHFGGWKERHDTKFETFGVSRLLLENIVRERVLKNPRVRCLDSTVVRELVRGHDGAIAGVKLDHRGDKGAEAPKELACDFLVDASGRESKAPLWLEHLGYTAPEQTSVNSFLGYATRVFKKPENAPRAWTTMIIHPTPPQHTRLGALFPIEGDRWSVTLGGVNRDYPPTDEAGFLEFARGCASPELYDALKNAEPLGPIHGYRRTENRLRHYDKLERYLEGFVVLGDAACAFNPVYGQGISTGAMAAETLGEVLTQARGDISGVASRFQKLLAKRLFVPWFLATSEDHRYEMTEGGKLGALGWVAQRYVDRLIRLSVTDAEAFRAFVEVMHMTGSLGGILSPKIVWRSLLRGEQEETVGTPMSARSSI